MDVGKNFQNRPRLLGTAIFRVQLFPSLGLLNGVNEEFWAYLGTLHRVFGTIAGHSDCSSVLRLFQPLSEKHVFDLALFGLVDPLLPSASDQLRRRGQSSLRSLPRVTLTTYIISWPEDVKKILDSGVQPKKRSDFNAKIMHRMPIVARDNIT